jgi:hypothetical protein
MSLSNCQQILCAVNTMLKEQFHIHHATLQLEIQCAEDDLNSCQTGLTNR